MFNQRKIGKLDIQSQERADQIRLMLEKAQYHTLSVEAKPTKRNPFPPFTTSTLQQAASSKLGFSASRTMQIAQKLYEGIEINGEMAGLITYMRTDGVQIAPEAIDAARKVIHESFGKDYVPENHVLLNESKMHRKRMKQSAQQIFNALPIKSVIFSTMIRQSSMN